NNNNHALPLSTTTSSIAVVGPLANDASDQLGPDVPIGYSSSDLTSVVPVLDGIKAAVPHATVTYAQGCDANCTSTSGFGAAVSAAQAAAVTVVVVGEPSADSGEASSRSDISLPGQQTALVQAIAATGKPYVVVLMNGRPLTLGWVADNAPGLLEAWYPGTEGGNAVADVLFGDVNPGGKLTVSWAHTAGEEPLYYNHNLTHEPEDRPGFTSRYWDMPSKPLYPFGYGLSYTSFKFGNLRLSRASMKAGEASEVEVDVTNTGKATGDAVAQVYIHQRAGSASRPVRQLKGFKRVTLKAGETQTVKFTLGKDELEFWSPQTKVWAVEPGTFDVWAGEDSTAGLHAELVVTE
ncbi:MAG: glycoside hydrolase family 3 C-terminal domain-containing protein, partial [Acidobacteriota bacterium]|nr:glycoside hydrolase family 3 C-terminal domain-containing protein [Acidobacteriota bacterium]